MAKNNFLFLFFLFINISFCLYSFGQDKTDSLLGIIANAKPDTNTANAYADLCYEYCFKNPESAINYGLKGIKLSTKISYYQGIAKGLNNIGAVYISLADYNKAYNIFLQSLKINETLKNKTGISFCYNSIGNIFLMQGNQPLALIYFHKSLEICELINDKNGISKCFNNIGNIYLYQKNYSLALKYFKESLRIAKETEDIEAILSEIVNIGNVYYFQKNYSLALKYYLKALNISKNANTYVNTACFNNIGIIYREIGNYEAALEYLQKSLDVIEKVNNKYETALTLNNIAELYSKTGKYEKAIEYASRSLTIAKEINSLERILKAASTLADCYFLQGDYKKAFEYHTLFKETNDSIYSIASSKQIKEIEAKYQNEKKEKEIINKNAKISLLEQKGKIERYKLIGAIGAVCIIILIFFNYRRRVKLNNQLFENKQKYLETQKLLTQAELDNEKIKRIQLQNELSFKNLEIDYKNQELKYKNQELANFAIYIVEKNEFLYNLKSSLSAPPKNIVPSEIIKTIDQHLINLEKERKEFENNIEQISQAFFLKLRANLPDITKYEERLSALLKLNLSSKEIAVIFNISSQSVDMARHRLRKKLNLDKDASLYDYFNNL